MLREPGDSGDSLRFVSPPSAFQPIFRQAGIDRSGRYDEAKLPKIEPIYSPLSR